MFVGTDVKGNIYRPLSEASESYVFTGICLSKCGGWGGGVATPNASGQHLPPPGHGHGTWSQHPPPPWMGPGHNAPPWTWDLATTPPPSSPGHGTWSQHPPSPLNMGPGHNTPPPPSPMDMGPGHNTPPGKWDLVTTPSPPPMDMGPGHNTPPTPDYMQAGGTHPTGMHSCSTGVFHSFRHGGGDVV